MGRRTFMALVSGGLLAAPLDAGAQQPPKVPRVGILFFGIPASPSEPAPLIRALVEGLRSLGWVEGRNVPDPRWVRFVDAGDSSASMIGGRPAPRRS
jgi:hypothetical protein